MSILNIQDQICLHSILDFLVVLMLYVPVNNILVMSTWTFPKLNQHCSGKTPDRPRVPFLTTHWNHIPDELVIMNRENDQKFVYK